MTAEIRIRHCRIEARPASGSGLCWADGQAHRDFARRVQTLVLAMLDELLPSYLAGIAPSRMPRSLALDLRLDSRDLAGAAPLARRHLRDRAGAAIAAALARAPESAPDSGSAVPAPESPRPAEPAAREGASAADPLRAAHGGGRPAILDLLIAWRRDRQLDYRLALLSGPVLARLIEASLAELAGRHSTKPDRSADSRASPAPADPPPAPGKAARRSLRDALGALVAAAAEAAAPGAGPVHSARLKSAVAAAESALRRAEAGRGLIDPGNAAAAPAAPAGSQATGETEPPGSAPSRARRDSLPDVPVPDPARPKPASRPRVAGRAAAAPLAEGRYVLDSALPFLALQRLARHGILAAAAALDRSGRQAGAMAALAFAFALRAQDRPAADGRWSAAQLADAAVLAGLDRPLESAELLAAALEGADMCDSVAGAVGASLIAGRRPGLPLPLLADSGRLVVFEGEGLFPLCRLSAARVADAFAGRGEAFFVADPDSALLRDIDSAGLLALASGPPARGEAWRPAATGRGWRGMTNMTPARFASLVPRLPEAERAARRAVEVWHALTAGRPLSAGPAREDFLDFDRTSALLAGFALADIAWTMFGRDPAAWAEPDPLLAVERFADLSATVEVTPDEVIVLLPLGARFADLRDSGLLDTIGDVPCWPGRRISFRGG